MRSLLVTAVLAALVLGGVAASASGGSSARARATALAASGSVGPHMEASSRGTGSQQLTGAVQTEALSVRDAETIARTSVDDGAVAEAIAVARSVDALDGMVTAYGARREATIRPDGAVYEGRVLGLRIAGDMVGDVTGPAQFPLPDGGGTVYVNRGGVGIQIVLAKPAAGQPAGTDLRVAVVGGEVRAARAAKPAPKPTATPDPPATRSREKKKRGGKQQARRPARVPAHLTRGGFAFPVYGGDVSVADDFGGPRQIGPHQGNDIFAAFGSPVLAVTDGTLQKVGTLPISGNRLWLVTDTGEAFFYAHLASFSELAETGRRVEAGDVLGFVGNTGDAEPTPPHVHFEIHPDGIDAPAADPHEVLLAWQRQEDVAPSAWLRRVGADTTERPGALIEVRDFIAGE